MSNYNFTENLSPLDFELLSKDLLETALGIRFQTFAEGCDGGVDLLHDSNGKKIIVQCKRYKQDALSRLKSDLRLKELGKVKVLAPTRYILTTSVKLNPKAKDDIKDILNPYILSTDDIFGHDDLNALLTSHSDIEKSHVKLWATTTGVLETILHAGVHQVSQQEIERTVSAAKLYVKNKSFSEALHILNEHRVCIIAGAPGIGKTTLARMLMLYFLDEYELIKIEGDITEARIGDFHKKPRFYYYDDFLGQTTSAEKLGKNEDQKLLDFMTAVHESKNSYMILTTREYILNQAKQHYEKIGRTDFNQKLCVIDLTKYARKIRAEILYNHLHFSKLPKAYLNSLVVSRSYIQIVDHPNYNPRLIEYLTNTNLISDLQHEDYPKFFLQHLDNPIEIWIHAFEEQISDHARSLLLVLTTLPSRFSCNGLKAAYNKFHKSQCRSYSHPNHPMNYERGIKELDGSFISISSTKGNRVIEFHSPSVRDFMQQYLLNNDEYLSKILEELVFFEQASWFSDILAINEESLPLDLLKKKSFQLHETLVCLFHLPNIAKTSSFFHSGERVRSINRSEHLVNLHWAYPNEKSISCVRAQMCEWHNEEHLHWLEVTSLARFILSQSTKSITQEDSFIQLFQKVKEQLIDDPEIDHFDLLAELHDNYESLISSSDLDQIRESLINYSDDFVEQINSDYDDPDVVREQGYILEAVGKRFDVDLSDYEKALCSIADEKEKTIEEASNMDPDDMRELQTSNLPQDGYSNSAMNTLFSKL